MDPNGFCSTIMYEYEEAILPPNVDYELLRAIGSGVVSTDFVGILDGERNTLNLGKDRSVGELSISVGSNYQDEISELDLEHVVLWIVDFKHVASHGGEPDRSDAALPEQGLHLKN